MKGKKTLVSVSILSMIFVLLIIIRMTRVEYINNYESNAPALSDAEYLNTSDLRLLKLFRDNKVNKQLQDLTQDMIQESFQNNGKSDKYEGIIDSDSFERLDPDRTYDKQPAYELRQLQVKCLSCKNKAIVYWSKECNQKGGSNKINCNINTQKPPFERLYFEKTEGLWKAVSLNDPA